MPATSEVDSAGAHAPILVLNAGSSSLKYLLTGRTHDVGAGVVSHVGEPSGPRDHAAALAIALDSLADHVNETGLAAIGHRVVHGGADMRTTRLKRSSTR
jgi:acetate kinase